MSLPVGSRCGCGTRHESSPAETHVVDASVVDAVADASSGDRMAWRGDWGVGAFRRRTRGDQGRRRRCAYAANATVAPNRTSGGTSLGEPAVEQLAHAELFAAFERPWSSCWAAATSSEPASTPWALTTTGSARVAAIEKARARARCCMVRRRSQDRDGMSTSPGVSPLDRGWSAS